ncbi:hypothetical protein AB1Y20_018508 [Prymnesium parvum]|uniref:DUF4476 domain-containing protein n=1 Tax=Prymnesium parvum TaxID=97485 RepID=A0AB34JR50_PRYPA
MADQELEDGEEGEEEWESEASWESDVDSEAEIAEIMQLDLTEEAQQSGKQEYLTKCSELKIVPVAMFIAKLECEYINLRHHGMGVKGAICISAALMVNQKIRSLNLGDNWFGNEGVHAIAEVLSTNTTLTSLNLSDNRIGLPGARSLCRRLQDNNSLAELNLKGNKLDDRAAVPLSEALRNSSSLTKVDLSYNQFGEAAGKLFGEMLSGHAHLLEVNLKWNALKAKGGAAVAEGIKNNQVLNKVDLGWNGLGDKGTIAVGDMLTNNTSITHLDVSHNRINLDGALALSEGIKNNQNLLSLELGFNPMGMQQGMVCNVAGVQAIVEALKHNGNLETVGLTNVQSGGSTNRGRASRFDPKNPDGHYVVDLSQPWDRFLAETLYDRMMEEGGESWINVTFDSSIVEIVKGGEKWELPAKGTLEFDYITWKRGLEATFELDLSNPCELFMAEQLFSKAAAAESDGGNEALRECRLNDTPFEPGSELPNQGTLHVVYYSTKPKDELEFDVQLNLGIPNGRVMCQRLWERCLTTPTDTWKDAKLDGSAVDLSQWEYPEVPQEGDLELTYAVRLAIKPYDRGVHFTSPMDKKAFGKLEKTLSGQALTDFDKVHLITQAALRNYFTSQQVQLLLGLVTLRKGKLEVAVMLHARMVDEHNFNNVLQSLGSEADRQAVLDMVEANNKRKGRKMRK